MLIIRKRQMDILGDYLFGEFISKMIVHLRRTYPDDTNSVDDEVLARFIRENVSTANQFNIRAADNLETFIDCTMRYGLDFFKSPDYKWAEFILRDNEINEMEKMNRIVEYEIFSGGLCDG